MRSVSGQEMPQISPSWRDWKRRWEITLTLSRELKPNMRTLTEYLTNREVLEQSLVGVADKKLTIWQWDPFTSAFSNHFEMFTSSVFLERHI